MRVIDTFRTIVSLAFSPDGRWLAAAGYGHVSRWELATGRERPVEQPAVAGYCQAVVFSPDSKWFAWGVQSGSGVYRVAGVQGASRAVVEFPDPEFIPFGPTNHGFLADGRHVALGTNAVTVFGRGKRDGRQSMFRLPANSANRLATAPDGKSIAVAGKGGVALWAVRDRKWTPTAIDPRPAVGLGFTARGLLWFATADGVSVVDPATNEWPTRDVKVPFPVKAVTPDGRFAFGAVGEKPIAAFDLWHAVPALGYDWGVGRIDTVAVSPDGLTAAAAGASGQIVLFDLD